MLSRLAVLALSVTLLASVTGTYGNDSSPTELQPTVVFTSGAGGYHTYRIPSLLRTRQGTLLAFCEARKNSRDDHGDVDLVLRRSTDDGKTWGPVQLVCEEGGNARITIGNPCPVVDHSTGRIWLPLTRNNDRVWMLHSDDDGQTWSKPDDITSSVKLPDWTWYATGPGVGVQLKHGEHAGRLIIPCDHRAKADSKTSYSHVFYSDDHGATWRLGGSTEKYMNECQLAELSDGTLLLNIRNHWRREAKVAEKGGKRALSRSQDGGETWSEVTFDETLIEPVCQASLIRLEHGSASGDVLAFSNPASTRTREKLTLRLSTDGGRTWPISHLIHAGPASYSCLAELPSGEVACLYECGQKQNYETIAFVRMSRARLQARK